MAPPLNDEGSTEVPLAAAAGVEAMGPGAVGELDAVAKAARSIGAAGIGPVAVVATQPEGLPWPPLNVVGALAASAAAAAAAIGFVPCSGTGSVAAAVGTPPFRLVPQPLRVAMPREPSAAAAADAFAGGAVDAIGHLTVQLTLPLRTGAPLPTLSPRQQKPLTGAHTRCGAVPAEHPAHSAVEGTAVIGTAEAAAIVQAD